MLLPLLRVVVSAGCLCLIAATRNLWFGGSGFPVIPLIGGLTGVPQWVDSTLSILLVGTLLNLLGISMCDVGRQVSRSDAPDVPVCGRSVRLACVAIVLTGIGLVLLNQHRLQPWLYHLMLLCPILAIGPTPTRKDETRSVALLVVLLTASLYFWSAISKCDRAFVEGHGQTFVEAIAGVLGVSLKFWSPEMRATAAATLPVGELLVAIGLLIARFRRPALLASLLMHGLLITAVGPWAMDQRPGVMIWNLLFILQNVLLLRFRAHIAVSAPVERASRSLLFARAIVLVAAVLPALRFAGWYDNWPSWAVYTASNERVYVLVAEDAVDRLLPEVQRFVQPRAINDGWMWLRTDLWSIAAVDAPLYPQKRFFVACALAVAQQGEL
ncbi:MAG: hypothetical protein ACYTGL_12145, partial [Planctomycetota bacterium]